MLITKKKLEIVGAVVILILLLLLLWFVLRKPKTEVPINNEPEQVVDSLPEVNPADVPAPGVVSASTIGRIFVERFGSYSSESNFENVDDVMSLATPSYQAELETLVASYRRQVDEADGYTGISTVVIGVTVISESETDASFLIMTQREEAVGNPGNTTLRYQNAEASLVKSGDDWLIDDLAWK